MYVNLSLFAKSFQREQYQLDELSSLLYCRCPLVLWFAILLNSLYLISFMLPLIFLVSAAMLVSHRCGLSSGCSTSDPADALLMHLRGQQKVPAVEPLHPYWRLRRNSWILALSWPNLGSCNHFGVNQYM